MLAQLRLSASIIVLFQMMAIIWGWIWSQGTKSIFSTHHIKELLMKPVWKGESSFVTSVFHFNQSNSTFIFGEDSLMTLDPMLWLNSRGIHSETQEALPRWRLILGWPLKIAWFWLFLGFNFSPVVIAQIGARVRQKCNKRFFGPMHFLEVSKTTYCLFTLKKTLRSTK